MIYNKDTFGHVDDDGRVLEDGYTEMRVNRNTATVSINLNNLEDFNTLMKKVQQAEAALKEALQQPYRFELEFEFCANGQSNERRCMN